MMLIGLLAIPITMVIIGSVWMRKHAARINWFYGYRTWWSMKSQATWDFAHRHLAELWFKLGLALGAVSVGYWVTFNGSSPRAVEYLVGRMVLIQVVLMFVPVVMTEVALRKRFDRNGNQQ